MQLTVVTREFVLVDYTLMAEFTDGSVREFSVGWGKPTEADLRAWKFLTLDKLRQELAWHQCNARHESNDRLHRDKVRRLGWDYATRGYK